MSNLVIVILALSVFNHYAIVIHGNMAVLTLAAAFIVDGCRALKFILETK